MIGVVDLKELMHVLKDLIDKEKQYIKMNHDEQCIELWDYTPDKRVSTSAIKNKVLLRWI